MKRVPFSHPDKYYSDHVARIAQSFSEEKHRVVANFHDLGKLSEAFQKYITLKKEAKESAEAFEKRRAKLKTTHTLESAYLYFFTVDTKDVNFLGNFFAILKHHTYLPDILNDANDYLSVIDNYISNERQKSIEVIAQTVFDDFSHDIYEFIDYFEDLNNEGFFKSLDNFFLFKKRYSRLILADKFEAIFSQPYKNIDYLSSEAIDNYIKKMHEIIKSKPKNTFRNSAKKTILNNYTKKQKSNIYLVKAPTGVGKTFIALELAMKIAKEREDKRRIITAIPFTSIIDQTHSEYEKILGEGSVLKYHHLTKRVNDDSDEKEQFSQKVFLADIWHEHFIVTTFNQLLFTLFSNKNRDNLRLETLRDSVIIIDEVQNISRVILKDVAKILELFANEYNIHFIIMSATMPSFEGVLNNATPLSESWFYHEKKNRYRLHYSKKIKNFKSLADTLNNLKEQSVLCVVNTIEKAKKLFDRIDGVEGEYKFLLTTHQIPLHRKEIIEEIKEALSKGKKVKLIATQLIEAGVDLDFDIGFREFAPFGSIIQMAGRVNREGTRDVCDVFVFDFLDVSRGDHVNKLPYHQIDLQEKDVKKWLKKPLEEIEILENITTYFQTLQNETSSVNFLDHMEKLEFQTLFEKFNDNFMPKQPWKVSLFVEVEADQFNSFLKSREEILNSYNNKFEAINRIKELEKSLGQYTISVNENLIRELIGKKHNIKENFGRYILPYGSMEYAKYRGFNLDFVSLDEIFD